MNAWPAFIGGMCGWGFILFEIFAGEAGGSVAGCSEAVATSFNNMRMIVTVGWSIYPLGYLFGYLLGAVDETFLNVIYNIADLVNKIAFVLSCWSCAKADSGAKDGILLRCVAFTLPGLGVGWHHQQIVNELHCPHKK